jgi:NitT/TauT family transport system substrate-binding protein
MKILALVGISAAIIALSAVAVLSNSPEVSGQNKIRVVFFANVNHMIPVIGLENGEFAKELGGITIQPIIVDSGPQAIEALFANSADIAYVGPAPFITGYVKSGGEGLRILSGATTNGASFVIQKDSTISIPSDLAGKKIAAPSLGNTQDVSLRYYLSQNNLKPAEKGGSVVVYNIANAEIYTLFAKGDIDAAWVPEPTATQLVEQLGAKRLFQEEDLWQNKQFSSVILIGRTDYIEKHPDWIAKWLKAHKNTIQWINQNPEDSESKFIEFYREHTGKKLPEKIIHESFSNIIITDNPNLDSIRIMAERSYDLGYLGRKGYNLDNIFYNTEAAQWQS